MVTSKQSAAVRKAIASGELHRPIQDRVGVTAIELFCIHRLSAGLDDAQAADWTNELAAKHSTAKACLDDCSKRQPERVR